MSAARTERFAVGPSPAVDVELPAGEVIVTAGADAEVTVEIRGPDAERFDVELVGAATVTVRPVERRMRWRSHRLLLRVPAGTKVESRTASADLDIEVDIAALRARSASGVVSVGDVRGDADASSQSGDVRVGRVGGEASLQSVSGDVVVAAVSGSARLETVSGDVRAGVVEGPLSARTVSGDIEVGSYAGAALSGKTMSGDVRVGLPSGRNLAVALQSMSGDVRTPFDVDGGSGDAGSGGGAPDGRVELRSLSGDIVLTRGEPG